MSNIPFESPTAIVIHGGSGTITKVRMTGEKEAEIRAVLEASIRAGHKVLLEGAPGTEAVKAAINVMENSPLFNAGKGAVYNAAGDHEMDASIMEGKGLNAGAVASVSHIRNPIDLALKVMTESEHVMLMGEGAEEFARQHGFEMMDPAWFGTEFRWQQLQRIKAREIAETETDKEDQQDRWFLRLVQWRWTGMATWLRVPQPAVHPINVGGVLVTPPSLVPALMPATMAALSVQPEMASILFAMWSPITSATG